MVYIQCPVNIFQETGGTYSGWFVVSPFTVYSYKLKGTNVYKYLIFILVSDIKKAKTYSYKSACLQHKWIHIDTCFSIVIHCSI